MDKLSSMEFLLSGENLFITQSVRDILFGFESSTLQLVSSVASESNIDEVFGILKKVF